MLLCGGACAFAAARREVASGDWPRWSLRQMFAVIACLALILSALIHQTPFLARFALARHAIDRLAEHLELGQRLEHPCLAGTFLIRQAEIRPPKVDQARKDELPSLNSHKRVYLWTDLSPGGRSGFAQNIPQNDSRYFTQVRLDDRWWFVVED